ncbi:hypothetical protein DS885_05500 [Psychromonas sp. B3M02]|uniref:hypothetical protein n=1 Tax=Psychromonas sp. B3M02 TaxID=2267226 RepID=UPI000DE9D3A3|nr:hypothetical protein [Psychromonas sp. B3M02]RBW46963.1 hypothetical protein DS885_05500 [Psychromonas sp. B3M02]
MKLIVHIGTEKTGTSSIQNALFENKVLLLKAGFYFSQCAGNRNNIQFPLSCMGHDREDEDHYFTRNGITTSQQRGQYYNDLKKNFVDEVNALKDIHTVIISSEHFHSLLVNVQEVETFKALLGNMFSSIKIVCYLRDQVATCISHYSTRIKTGDSDELSTFIQRCSPQNPYYNYLDLLDRWSAVFGKSNLVVDLFDKKNLKNNDIVDDFFYKIEFDAPQAKIVRSKQINQSLNYIGQCLLKAINSDPTIKKPLNPAVSKFIDTQYSGKAGNVDGPTYQRLFQQFKVINTQVALKYFNKKTPMFLPSLPQEKHKNEEAEQVIKDLFPLIQLLICSTTDDIYADICRDVAIKLENAEIDAAYNLMSLAHKIRPEGPTIKSKLRLYSGLINEATKL